MTAIPKLPDECDGVFDWAIRAGVASSRLDRVREIRRQTLQVTSTCGSCVHWMKRECPKEKTARSGISKGPSCNSHACTLFVMDRGSESLVSQLRAEMADAEKKLTEMSKP